MYSQIIILVANLFKKEHSKCAVDVVDCKTNIRQLLLFFQKKEKLKIHLASFILSVLTIYVNETN